MSTNPRIGRPRDDLAPGVRSLPVSQHTILYRIESAAIRVPRILHVRRDLGGQLGP